jgi:hypothetical protein
MAMFYSDFLLHVQIALSQYSYATCSGFQMFNRTCGDFFVFTNQNNRVPSVSVSTSLEEQVASLRT